jgi:hypothetical protein
MNNWKDNLYIGGFRTRCIVGGERRFPIIQNKKDNVEIYPDDGSGWHR